ncbi:hypothetical protein JTB14_006022 [Gonioctena quinquepunctata]|nr:hypothetical protein JTB14_006022 [Gonioctena quinquepunctata]
MYLNPLRDLDACLEERNLLFTKMVFLNGTVLKNLKSDLNRCNFENRGKMINSEEVIELLKTKLKNCELQKKKKESIFGGIIARAEEEWDSDDSDEAVHVCDEHCDCVGDIERLDRDPRWRLVGLMHRRAEVMDFK